MMNKKLVLGITILTITVLSFSVWLYTSKPSEDIEEIENTVRGYIATYNAEDFTTCLTYFTGYGDKEDALAFLSFMRSYSGPLELRKVKSIVYENPQTANVTVAFTIAGEEGSDSIRLKKVNNEWKIVWRQGDMGVDSVNEYLVGEVDFVLPGEVEIFPEFQETLQVEHYIWMGTDGKLRIFYRFRNIRNQPTAHLYFICEVYDAEGELLIYHNPSGILEPGGTMSVGDILDPEHHMTTPIHSAAYYKIKVAYYMT